MYDKLRNDFILELSKYYPTEDINKICKCLDYSVDNYDITEKQTGLIIYEPDEIPVLVKEYIAVKRIEGLSEKTLKNYFIFLAKFFTSVNKTPQQVEKNDIMLFLYRYKEERQISDRTLDKIREYICRFFNWLCDEGYLERSPARTIKPIKYEIKEREGLTMLELEYVRNACETLREKAMIEFFYSTGCRVSELAIVKRTDIDFITGEVKLFGKGKKHRVSYLNPKAKVALKEYWLSRSDNVDIAFISEKGSKPLQKEGIEKAIRKIAVRSGINKKLTPHVIRHTTATQGLNNGMPIESIQMLLGHSSINTTMIYAKTSMDRVKMEHQRYVI